MVSKPRPRHIRHADTNERQEAFAVEYFLCRNAKAAALKAGYPPTDADSYGLRLLKQSVIQERLQELQAAAVTDSEVAIAAVAERLALLSEIARHEVETPVTASHVIQAVSEMNKMQGSYAPEKHAILGDIRILVEYVDRSENNQGAVASPSPTAAAYPRIASET